jgi:hypothetical protein
MTLTPIHRHQLLTQLTAEDPSPALKSLRPGALPRGP